MKTSKDRILTTHTGSLPRPKPLIDLVMNRERGEMIDAAAFAAETARAIDDIVAQQLAAGIDVVSDGEMSKPSYTTYIRHRVSGIEPDPRAAEKGRDIMIGRDLLAHPDFARRRNFSDAPFPGCIGPARYKDRSELDRDIANLKSAAGKSESHRRVHDRAVARHPHALHHQPALSERGCLRGSARRCDEDRVPAPSSRPASCCRSMRPIWPPRATTSTAT